MACPSLTLNARGGAFRTRGAPIFVSAPLNALSRFLAYNLYVDLTICEVPMVDTDFAWRLTQGLVRIDSSDPGAYEGEIERYISWGS